MIKALLTIVLVNSRVLTVLMVFCGVFIYLGFNWTTCELCSSFCCVLQLDFLKCAPTFIKLTSLTRFWPFHPSTHFYFNTKLSPCVWQSIKHEPTGFSGDLLKRNSPRAKTDCQRSGSSRTTTTRWRYRSGVNSRDLWSACSAQYKETQPVSVLNVSLCLLWAPLRPTNEALA